MVRVLVVDDEQDFIELVTEILKREGYDVDTALSGEEALQFLEEGQTDLILLDLMMPEMDGFDLCKKLGDNPKTSKIPIIMVTVKGDFESIENAYKCMSVKNYITKPFEKENLIKIVGDVLESEKEPAPRKKHPRGVKTGIYKEIVESYPDGIVIMNSENTVIDVNDSFEGITGFLKEDVLGAKNLPELIKPQDDEGNTILVSEAFRACFCDEPTSTSVFNIINKNGVKIKVACTVFKIKSKTTVIVLRNITQD
jgi:PAS domain S-box-containing protein